MPDVVAVEAIAIVNNPTQLLFAIEAAEEFRDDVRDLRVIIVPTPAARDELLYRNILDAAGIADVESLAFDSLTRFGRARDVGRFRLSIPSEAMIITPMLNYLPARSLLHRAGQRAVVTDDGSWTLHFAAQRRSGASQFRTPLHALLPGSKVPDSLTFFTIYDDMIAGPHDRIVSNRLAWSRHTFHRGDKGAGMVILGSDLARSGYITDSEFASHVGALRACAVGAVEYWPHRREDLRLAEGMCNRLGMALKQRTLPLEAEILAADPSPALVGTLPSTATRTLRVLRETVGYRVVVSIPDDAVISHERRVLFEPIARSARVDADRVL